MSESPSQWTALLNSNLGLSLKTLRRGVQVFLDGLQSSIILLFLICFCFYYQSIQEFGIEKRNGLFISLIQTRPSGEAMEPQASGLY